MTRMGNTEVMSDSFFPLNAKRGLGLLACGLGLLLVCLFQARVDPLVELLGVAHARIGDGPTSKILVVDHLASADAPTLHRLFQGEIWGRHQVRGATLVLPMLTLAFAFAGLLALALKASKPMKGLGREVLPSALLGIPLFLGACGAALWPGLEKGELYALSPWLFSLVAVILVTVLKGSDFRLRASFAALTSARWLWLGFLLLSPSGFFRWEPSENSTPSGLSLLEIVALLALLAGISQARRWCADLEGVSRPWTRLCIGELWLILPTFAVAAAVGSLNSKFLMPYLLTVLTSCLMLGWARRPSHGGALALALGCAALLVGVVAGKNAWTAPTFSTPFVAAREELQDRFGYQVRLGEQNGTPLLVICGLDLSGQSEAIGIVAHHLEQAPDSVNVRTRRGERTARFVLALTVTLFLVVSTLLLTVAPAGQQSTLVFGSLCLLAGLNGAFALTSFWGWFWMDPTSHLAGMFLASVLAWMSLGHARAWVDGQISESVCKPLKS